LQASLDIASRFHSVSHGALGASDVTKGQRFLVQVFRGAAFCERGVVLADLLVGPVVAVQQQGQLQAEAVNPGGVHVDRRRAHRELDEIVVLAVR